MRAVVYQGANEVAVQHVDDPRLQDPTDVLVGITTTAICGSDLHMYEGRTVAEPGIVFGHENMGIVEEVGSGVASIQRGDRVVMPFNVGCGFCTNCMAGNTAFCLTVNPPGAGGAYGYVGTVRATGLIGVVGLYLPQDPGAPSEDAANGRLLFQVGRFFEKRLRMGHGQANVKRYNQSLRDLIVAGRAEPSFVVSKRVALDQAPDAYRRFDQREEGYSKVVLDPAASPTSYGNRSGAGRPIRRACVADWRPRPTGTRPTP